MVFTVPGHIHRPETTVAGDVPKKATVTVGGTNYDAGTRVTFDCGAVGVAVLIIGAGDEGFHNLHIHLLDAVQLGQLQNPVWRITLSPIISPHFTKSCDYLLTR